MMPTLETGKTQSGYTLLEVLAVLILIGFIGTLAFPAFFRSEEKLAIDKIEDIIRNDWERLRQDAMVNKTSQSVTFDSCGYSFEIGAIGIRRSFETSNFTWKTPEKDNGDDETETPPASGVTEMIFTTDGSCTAGEWGWETPHFRGVMHLDTDGTMEWNYERK